MKFFVRHLYLFFFGVLLCFVLAGCRGGGKGAVGPVKIGIIASLSGKGKSWGEVTVACAEVIADHYNRMGGIQVDGFLRPIELIVRDDSTDVEIATQIAYEFTLDEDIRYVIGPLGDDSVVAVAPILNTAGVCFIHYGFAPDLVKQEHFGILGMPAPAQTLPLLFEFLQEEHSLASVCVITRNSREGVFQKTITEGIVQDEGIEVLRVSVFDIREETFDLELPVLEIEDRLRRLADLKPDGVVLTGLFPDELPLAVRYLRKVGFIGLIIAQNAQDPNLLKQVEEASDGLYFVGGEVPTEQHSPYYFELREHYLKLQDDWSAEVDTKLYAMEVLIQIIQKLEERKGMTHEEVVRFLDNLKFDDPFTIHDATISLVGKNTFGAKRQISVPVILSGFRDGDLTTVRVAKLPK